MKPKPGCVQITLTIEVESASDWDRQGSGGDLAKILLDGTVDAIRNDLATRSMPKRSFHQVGGEISVSWLIHPQMDPINKE